MRKRPVAVFMLIGFLTIFTFFVLLQMMPYIIRLPTGLAMPAEMVGFILIPGTLCDMVAGPLTGRMIPVTGCRIPCMAGSLFLISAGVLLILVPVSGTVLVIAWMLFSFGMSMVATADLIGVMDYVGEERTAEATGIIQSMQTLGGMIGPIVTGIILASYQTVMVIHGENWEVPEPVAYHLVFLTIIAVSSIILIISFLFLHDRHTEGYDGSG
jgi:MFS family permease